MPPQMLERSDAERRATTSPAAGFVEAPQKEEGRVVQPDFRYWLI